MGISLSDDNFFGSDLKISSGKHGHMQFLNTFLDFRSQWRGSATEWGRPERTKPSKAEKMHGESRQ